MASTLLMPSTKNGKGIKPEKLWPFEWEKKKTKTDKMSAERLQYLSERAKHFKK